MALFQKKTTIPKGEASGTASKIGMTFASIPKAALIAGCVVVAAVGVTCAVIFGGGGSNKGSTSDDPTVESLARSQMAAYSNVARGLNGIDNRTFEDSSIALSVFADEFNDASDGTLLVAYLEGDSYARTSAFDPFGTPYYITAKQDSMGANKSTYSFYMTSAGANKTFDTTQFKTDGDDISTVILQGRGLDNSDSAVSTTDFGLAEILATKPRDTDLNQNTEEPIVNTSTLPARATLTLNNQRGSGGTTSLRVKNGNSMSKYSVDIPSKENYEFVGYYTEINGGGTRMFDSMGVGTKVIAAFDGNTTLYAYWLGKEVLVNFDNNGGTGSESVNARYESSMPSGAVPTRAGYYFIGYYSMADGKGTKYYDSNGKGVIASNLTQITTLYAYWSTEAYTVQHYVMNTDGTYPSTPTKSESIANTSKRAVSMTSLVDQSYIVANGIVFSTGRVNGTESTLVEVADEDTVVSIYYSRCSYKVTLSDTDEGISEVTGDGTYLYGQRVTVTAKTADGYTWSSWKNHDTGATVSNSQKFQFDMGTSSISLDATTSATSYTITLNPNEGTCKTKSISVSYEEEYYSKLPTNATRTGYVFAGWSTKKGDSDTLAETVKYTTRGNSTLYAVWTADEYTISFDFQGGQGGTPSIKAKYGSTMPSIPALPTRTGYSFDGYYQSKNGKGLQYYDGSGKGVLASEFSGTVTLYANWRPSSVSINYYDKGGNSMTGSHEFGYPTSAKYGTLTTLKKATRTGYNFAGWFDNAACTGSAVTSVMADVYDGTINLFAKWEPVQVAITFDMNNDELELPAALTTITATYGQKLPALTNEQIPSNVGYRFLGFYTGRNGQGAVVYNQYGESSITSSYTQPITVYAYQQEIPVVHPDVLITFDREGGTGGSDSVSVAYNEILPTISIPSKTGYNFVGYYTGRNGTGTKQFNEVGTGLVRNLVEEDYTLYAAWSEDVQTTPTSCYVSFDIQGGTWGTTGIYASVARVLPDLTSVPTKTNYAFKGFFSRADGTGYRYFDNLGRGLLTCPDQESLLLYAKWEQLSYSVVYKNQGGDDLDGDFDFSSDPGRTDPEDTGYVGSAMAVFPVTKAGYTFGGWYLDAACATSPVDSSGLTISESDYETYGDTVTLYAKWIAD